MKINTGKYNIYTSDAFRHLAELLKKKNYSRHYILCDSNTMHNCLAILLSSVPALAKAEIIETESGEENKSLEVCAGIWQTLIEDKADRAALLINLGGGVVCDLGGFCASVYKRGIDFIHVPTTLLSMADASVGGKTGLDLLNVKNVIGTFSNPVGVFIEKIFLQTLPERHFYNGIAEIFKIALVGDRALFAYMEKEEGAADIQKLIDKSVSLKARIVKSDPFDRGPRKALNFGHTIGHALEGLALAGGGDLLHGEAIVAGMVIESHIAMQKKMLKEADFIRIVSLFLGFYGKQDFAGGLAALTPYLGNDKKNKKGEWRFVLPSGIGKARVDVPITKPLVKKALDFYSSLKHAEN